MKRIVTVIMLLATMAGIPGPAKADTDYTLVGALLGVGAGLVLAHNVAGVHREWAVPALALGGGWLGHELSERRGARELLEEADSGTGWVIRQRPLQVEAEIPENLHPGVTLIKIRIYTPTGFCRNVNLLRLGRRFVGPRGEFYDSQPTPEELALKYGK